LWENSALQYLGCRVETRWRSPRKKKAAVLALKIIRIVNAKTRANKQHSNAELEFSLLFNKEEEEKQ
jgi:hypothetical protein